MSLAAFFLLMALISLTKSRCSDIINRTFWFLKLVLLVALTYFSTKIPSDSYHLLYRVCIAISPVIMLWMFVCLIDLLYRSAVSMSTQYFEHGRRLYGWLMAITTAISIAASIYMTYQTIKAACSMWPVYTFGFLALSIVILTLLKYNEQANVVTSAVFIAAMCLVLHLSVTSDTVECATSKNGPSKVLQLAVYTVLAVLSILFISLVDDANTEAEDLENARGGQRDWQQAQSTDVSIDDVIGSSR